jgi:hypothetical protein
LTRASATHARLGLGFGLARNAIPTLLYFTDGIDGETTGCLASQSFRTVNLAMMLLGFAGLGFTFRKIAISSKLGPG